MEQLRTMRIGYTERRLRKSRLKSKKRSRGETERMKTLNEELRERNNAIKVEKAVRFRLAQAEEAEGLYKLMTRSHKRKKR